MISLRPYQADGIQRIREAIERGAGPVLAVAATGAGKTVIACSVMTTALEKGASSLFVAPRREIISQTYRKLIEAGASHEDVGVILAGVEDGARGAAADDPWRHAARRPWAPMQIASIDTLRNRPKPKALLVFLDEAHRSITPSYTELLSHYPDANVIGLTATPWGKDFTELYSELVVIASPRELMDLGFLVTPRGFTVPPKSLPDLSRVKMKGGDYDEKALADACDQSSLVGDIVETWQKRAAGMPTVAFAASVEHSKHIAARFNAAGIPAEHLDGETDVVTRSAILGRLKRGETKIVSNCAVLCEGWDSPLVSCCIMARPTKSKTLAIQCIGRILRPCAGKEQAIILDHAGVLVEHGMPQDPQEYELKSPKRRGSKEDCAKCCPECFEVVELGVLACPSCGFEFPVRARRELSETKGELVEFSEELKLRGRWDRLVAAFIAENARRMAKPDGRPRKPAWLRHEWTKKTGQGRIPQGVSLPKLSDEEAARIEAIDNAQPKVPAGPMGEPWGLAKTEPSAAAVSALRRASW